MSRCIGLWRTSACAALAVAPLCGAARAQWSVAVLHPQGVDAHASRVLGGRPGMVVGALAYRNLVDQPVAWAGPDFTIRYLDPPAPGGGALSSTNGLGSAGILKPQRNFPPHAAWWSTTTGQPLDLHPPGISSIDSSASAVDGNMQVGSVFVSGVEHASTWQGTAESWADIHPPGKYSSTVNDAGGGQQAGHTRSTGPAGAQHAGVWMGTAGSWVDLHAWGTNSTALGTDGGSQVGYSYNVLLNRHASLWHGTAASYVYLHPTLDPISRSEAHAVCGPYQVGDVGYSGSGSKAALWMGTAESYFDLASLLPASFDGNSQAYAAWIDGDFLCIGGMAYEIVVQESGVVGSEPRAVVWIKDLRPRSCGSADIGRAGGLPGRDGLLDNNDFIVFIGAFFDGDELADRGAAGGVTESDGLLDNNDFVAFINQFFAGC